MKAYGGFKRNKIWTDYIKMVIELLRSKEEYQTYLSRFLTSQILEPAMKLIDLISKLWNNKDFQRSICDVLPDVKSATQ
jgi:hypothetical protein